MRICFLIDSWFPVYGGGPAHVWEIAKRLVVSHGGKVDIITRKLLTDDGERGADNELHLGRNLRVIRLGPVSRFDNFFGRLWFLIRSFFYLFSSHYDIVNAQAFLPALPAKFSAHFTHTPVFFTVHGTGIEAWDQMQRGVGGKLKLFLEKALLFKMRYDKVVSVSEDFLQYPNINNDIQVIHNGVDINLFDQMNQKKNPIFTLLFVGRLHSQKGLTYLLRAIKSVVERGVKLRLHIIGNGDEKQDLLEEVKRLGIGSYVRFFGKVFGNDLIREYKASHAFILPSIYEGQPLTILEAWAAKLPVVATRVGGIPNIVDDGVDGFLVDPRNEKDLAAAILRCMSADHLSMGERGYQKVKEKFSWDKTASAFFDLYFHVLNAHQ